MRKVIFIFLVFNFTSYSQNANTKFLLSGFLMKNPEKISTAICEFKKGKKVIVLDFIGNNWWKVKYNTCIGYVKSPYLKMNDDLLRIEEDKWNHWKEEVKKDNDSIKRVDSIKKSEIKAKDSIKAAKINALKVIKAAKIKTKDSIKEIEYQELKKFIESTTSLTFNKNFIVTLKSNSTILVKPFPSAKILLIPNLWTDVYITDYIIGYYKVCVDKVYGYVRENEIIKNDYVIKYSENIKDKIYLKKFGKITYEKLKKKFYWLGMTTEMARISLGSPNDINRNVGSWGIHEQWVYNNRIYLYFENSILKSYQN